MWNKQARHLSSVLKSGAEAKKTKTQRMIEDAEKRQEALVGILKKDLDHNLRMVGLSWLELNYIMAKGNFNRRKIWNPSLLRKEKSVVYNIQGPFGTF